MRVRFHLRTLIGFVLGAALLFKVYVSYSHVPPWHQAGGMIGWSQSAIESRLGAPSQVMEYDASDLDAQKIRPRPAGTYRTLVFSRLDGKFVVCLKSESTGYVCFGSSWPEKGCFY
jgi:hypothetical protein